MGVPATTKKGAKPISWIKKNWVWVVVSAVLAYILYRVVTDKPIIPTGGNGNGFFGGGGQQAGQPNLDMTKVLHLGSVGNEVKELQKLINKAFALAESGTQSTIAVDGQFGDLTRSALLQLMGTQETNLLDAKNYFSSIFGVQTDYSDTGVWVYGSPMF